MQSQRGDKGQRKDRFCHCVGAEEKERWLKKQQRNAERRARQFEFFGQPPGLPAYCQTYQHREGSRGLIANRRWKGVKKGEERARPNSDEQFVMRPGPSRKKKMLSAVQLATVVKQKQHA